MSERYDPTQREWDARLVAEELLGVISWYEEFEGRRFDPWHQNARPELQRIACRVFGMLPISRLWKPYRDLINGLVDTLLADLRVRRQNAEGVTL